MNDFSVDELVEQARANLRIGRDHECNSLKVGELVVSLGLTASQFPFPKQNLSERLQKLVAESGLVPHDMSEQLSPNMTVVEFLAFQQRLCEGCRDQPRIIFYVTCDTVTPIEALLLLD